MNTFEEHIKIVQTKLQQLLKKNNVLQKENTLLRDELSHLKEKEKEYTASIFSLTQKLQLMNYAEGKISGPEQKEFEKQIDLYIKEIDKCIGILSE